MNRRATDKISDRSTLVRRLQKFTYEELTAFSVSQLQSIVLGLFGRNSKEYRGIMESHNTYGISHTICDECNIDYPGKTEITDTIKMLEDKITVKAAK